MADSVVPLLDLDTANNNLVGGKARNLAIMLQQSIPVPAGVIVGLSAFREGALDSQARDVLLNQLDRAKTYAVRSSAAAEDSVDASWAGQFETFLSVPYEEIEKRVTECHSSAKARAAAYAAEKGLQADEFSVAVVVQEMVTPEYAGVLFTKDPVTGQNNTVIEYVEGLGEELVSGRADPKRIVWDSEQNVDAPFDVKELVQLAKKIETIFGMPQDIEWVWANGQISIVQARAITTTDSESGDGYNIGEPADLFYWGPSRCIPMYMSDFMEGLENSFVEMARDPEIPSPPRTLALFWDEKVVFLINNAEFGTFVSDAFAACEKRDHLDEDWNAWKKTAASLVSLDGEARDEAIVKAWQFTELSEFALYGAIGNLSGRLVRFGEEEKQEIWAAFTVPDKPTFLAQIDRELVECNDAAAMAEKYPWIQDGYDGVKPGALEYFTNRLAVLAGEVQADVLAHDREALAKKLQLSNEELNALQLARRLAEFMDDRKMWMMQTRRLLERSIGGIEFGWYFDGKNASRLSAQTAEALWERYVNFRASSNAVNGVVASNGGRHFVSGEVVVVDSPTQVVPDDKIVVVPFTSPSYVPLMRKARALVTDHGGMMSHAAIVAREFGLPCIVGTKQATKVLNTGDQVVLDLVRGEVNR